MVTQTAMVGAMRMLATSVAAVSGGLTPPWWNRSRTRGSEFWSNRWRLLQMTAPEREWAASQVPPDMQDEWPLLLQSLYLEEEVAMIAGPRTLQAQRAASELASVKSDDDRRTHDAVSVITEDVPPMHTLTPIEEESNTAPSNPWEDMTEETVRQSPAYQVLTPEQTMALAEKLGDRSVFYLNPLLAGIDPAFSWEMLRLYEREVHPHLRRG